MCGSPDGGHIWTKNMGDAGACSACNPAVPMSKADQSRWSCSTFGDISMNKDKKEFDPRTCMSWSTEGSCEFRLKDLKAVQMDVKSSDCNGLWVAPVWMAPKTWNSPQHGTGEVDFFERGCNLKNGYQTSFGETGPYIFNNSWEEEGKPDADTSLTAYMTFDQNADEVTMYKCPIDSNPLKNGTDKCTKTATHMGFYKDTADQTAGHTEYMHLVSDFWNKCELGCGKGASMSSTKCSFDVTNLKLQFTDDSLKQGFPFKDQPDSPFCDYILYKPCGDRGQACCNDQKCTNPTDVCNEGTCEARR